jgi:2-methylaconitate cis-trans-isomerase PrpF
MISAGQPHKAIPLTGALGVAAAARIPDTIVAANLRSRYDPACELRIAHAAGVVPIASIVSMANGVPKIESVTAYRTSRRLMEGRVLYRKRSDI